jgi:prepilin peptidase CpaA
MSSHFPDVIHALREALRTHALLVVLCIIVITAALIDFLTHRLPNWLTVGSLVIALLLQFAAHGGNGVADGLSGFAAGFGLYLILYAAGAMGAGDVKLMGAVGAFLGWPAALLAACLSLATGVLVSLLLLGLRGGLTEYLSRYGAMFKCLFLTGQFAYVRPAPGSIATQRFPYGFAIAIGTLATQGWNGQFAPLLQALKTL